MTPRDRLQRLLFEHRTAHDPASSEREILRMFEEARKDTVRIDWLADPDNAIGTVQLPTACVLENLHSLRDAIDAAMKGQK